MAPNGRHQWVAIELNFVDNPKILEVGPLGGWAHLRAIIYCARHGTDGFIPQAAVWLILHDDMQMAELADSGLEASMVEAGLWHPVANGYQVHDYLEHQANAESIREKRRRAGRLGGLAKAKQTASKRQQSKLDVDVDVDKDKEPSFLPTSTYNGERKEGTEKRVRPKTEAELVAEHEIAIPSAFHDMPL